MKIVIRPHLKLRLKQREIPQDYPSKILSKPTNKYFDNETGHFIAIRSLKYYGKTRPMVVVYDTIDSEIQAVTVYPSNNQEIKNRLSSGRWAKYEKN